MSEISVVVQYALLAVIPMLALLTVFMWVQAIRYWPYKLPLAIALNLTLTGAAATWVVWTNLYYTYIGQLSDEFVALTAVSVLILCASPMLTPIYFVWLMARDLRNTNDSHKRDRREHDAD